MKVEKAKEPIIRGSGTFQPMGPDVSADEDNILRDFVTVTRAMNGVDFRLAAMSMFFLVLSAIFLIISMPIDVIYIKVMGVGMATIGFVILATALAYTAYASFFMLYPESK